MREGSVRLLGVGWERPGRSPRPRTPHPPASGALRELSAGAQAITGRTADGAAMTTNVLPRRRAEAAATAGAAGHAGSLWEDHAAAPDAPARAPLRPPRPAPPRAAAAAWSSTCSPRRPGIGLGVTIGLAVTAESAGSLSAPGGIATALGRLAGLLAAYAMVVVVLLVARVPPLERAIGQDRLVAWHRRSGPWPLYLLLAHAVLITVGYARAGAATACCTSSGSCCGPTRGSSPRPPARSSCSRPGSPPTGSRAGAWPTRPGGPCTSTPTSRCSCRSRTRSTRARRSSGIPSRASGGRCCGWGRSRSSSRRASALPVWRSLRHQVRVVGVQRRGPGRRVDPAARPPPRPAPGRGRAVLPVALPAPRAVVAGAPVLALGRAGGRPAADHGQGPRRPQRRAGPRSRPGRAWRSRARTAASPRTRAERDRVLLIGAGVGTAPILALLQELPAATDVTVLLRASTRGDLVLRDEVAARSAAPRRPARRARRPARRACRSTPRRCAGSSPTCAAARSSCAVPTPSRAGSPPSSSAPACPAPRSTSSPSPSETEPRRCADRPSSSAPPSSARPACSPSTPTRRRSRPPTAAAVGDDVRAPRDADARRRLGLVDERRQPATVVRHRDRRRDRHAVRQPPRSG